SYCSPLYHAVCFLSFIFSVLIRSAPCSALFPYTTLFRSDTFNIVSGVDGGEEFVCPVLIRDALIERHAVGSKPFPAFLRRRRFVPGLGKPVSPVAVFIKMPQERREIGVLCRVSCIADLCRYD